MRKSRTLTLIKLVLQDTGSQILQLSHYKTTRKFILKRW